MADLIDAIARLNLPAPHLEALHELLGHAAVVGHRLGFSPRDDATLRELIVDMVAEARA